MLRYALPLLVLATGCATTRDHRRTTVVDTELQRALAGKVAGTPVSCLSSFDTREGQTFDTAMLYRSGRNISYVNTLNDCPSLRSHDIPVVEVHGSQLCRGDIVRFVDRTSGAQFGACSFGDFVPYKTAGR